MSPLEGVRIALGSLIANPLRSFLTLLGIIIGITAIIAVISVINGLNIYVAERLSNLGPGVFVVQRFGLIPNHDDFMEALRRNKRLRMADADEVRERSELAAVVAVEVHATDELSLRGETISGTDIGGITAEILEIEPYDVDGGRIFTPFEVEHSVPVAFIGADVADRLFPSIDPLGRDLRVGNRKFTVVGIAKKRGSVLGFSLDNFIKIPISLHQRIYGVRPSVNISVKVADPTRMEDCMDEVRLIMRTRHHLKYDEPDDFGILTAEGLNTLWEDLTRIIFRVAVFVVGISLVVGGIVIMNIMLVSVIERRREIGLRKAVGARPRDIRLQFLIESVVLSSAGGVIGISVAWFVSWIVRTYTPLPAEFPLWAPLLAFVICGTIGVFFGLNPAAKAARLDPIEALRADA
jgi:putative ABC transport system permease protein